MNGLEQIYSPEPEDPAAVSQAIRAGVCSSSPRTQTLSSCCDDLAFVGKFPGNAGTRAALRLGQRYQYFRDHIVCCPYFSHEEISLREGWLPGICMSAPGLNKSSHNSQSSSRHIPLSAPSLLCCFWTFCRCTV